MLWIPLTVAATAFQVARNGAQRSLLVGAGPWGATLVRFLFGLPFSLAFLGLGLALVPGIHLNFTPMFWVWAAAGGAAQIAATAALLVAMHRSSFALGTAFQQSGVPFAALIGWLMFGDHILPLVWVGLLTVTVALMVLSWPRKIEDVRDWKTALLGAVAGVAFAFSANAYRAATRGLEPHHLIVAALATVVAAQSLQSLGLTSWMAMRDRHSLMAALRSWRTSFGAGFFGACASACWFSAFAISQPALVRAVGVVEMPIAAIAGRRLFAEKLSLSQWLWGAVTAAGVALAALAR